MEEIEYDLTNNSPEPVYVIPNPYWLSDKFVFRKDAELGSVYVKLNYDNKIEEIGIGIDKRMHCRTVDGIITSEHCKEADETQKTILNTISDEYWFGLRNREKYGKIRSGLTGSNQ